VIKTVKMVTMALALTVILMLSVGGVVFADDSDCPGPAPNSHDGVSDGPGWEGEIPFGPNGEIW
jgi:hypothetical protein